MEQVEHRRQPLHQVLPQFQVPQGQRLDHSEPKVRLEQPELLVLPEQLVRPGQVLEADQVLAHQVLEEQPALQESRQVGQLSSMAAKLLALGCCACLMPKLRVPRCSPLESQIGSLIPQPTGSIQTFEGSNLYKLAGHLAFLADMQFHRLP